MITVLSVFIDTIFNKYGKGWERELTLEDPVHNHLSDILGLSIILEMVIGVIIFIIGKLKKIFKK